MLTTLARLWRALLVLPAVPLVVLATLGHPWYGPDSGEPPFVPPPSSDDSVFQPGEELTYNVSFGPIDIGRVRITLLSREPSHPQSCYAATAHIDSYKGVPFVSLHAVYDDHMAEQVYSTWFHSRKKDGASWISHDYLYDYPRHRLTIEQGVEGSGRVDRRDTLQLDTLYEDGLSLFYLARTQLLSGRSLAIPTIVSEKKGSTTIRFFADPVGERIEAVDYPIDLIHFEGEAGFIGIFGLTGAFEGWFSNDAARVPVIANMKVLIGKIRIELVRWKRTGWSPPRHTGGPK